MIRVGVVGANGRMGTEVCRAVEADDELQLVARVGRDDPMERLTEATAEVAVDFTTPGAVKDNVRFCLTNGIHAVVGTTGLSDGDLDDVRGWAEGGGANCIVAPNFAVGAVLMMTMAAQAAPHFDTAEIIERHHERKLDAPSGTALRTAALMNDARGGPWNAPGVGNESVAGARGADSAGVRIHSVRAPGYVAHQEIVFGSPGETLTIRHDTVDRSSFMGGVLLAVKRVAGRRGLTVGLENILDL